MAVQYVACKGLAAAPSAATAQTASVWFPKTLELPLRATLYGADVSPTMHERVPGASM